MTPPYLNIGDKVSVVAPAGKVDIQLLKEGIQVLQAWGFVVEERKNIFGISGYFSGTDEERIADIQNAISNPEIKAIFCARGGFGTTKIIDSIDFSPLTKSPKWLIGFSDITALHLRFQNLTIPSIHGPVLVQFGKEEYKSTVEHLLNYLTNKQQYSLTFTVSYTLPDIELEGVITGGNLCLIADSLGTKDEIQTENKILFIEEVGEDIYRLDRMMTHLSRSGKLSSIKALLVGNLTNIKDTTPPYSLSAKEVILKQVNQYDYPVFFDIPAGHEPPNYALIFGTPMRITHQKKTISINEM